MAWRGGASLWGRRLHLAAALLALIAIAALAGCGDSNKNGEVSLTVGSRDTVEEEVLGHIYAEALRDAGYQVKGEFGIETEPRSAPLRALEKGEISGYPDPVNEILWWQFEVANDELPNEVDVAYQLAKKELRKEGMTIFAPTPYSRDRQFTFLADVAAENGFQTNSDLRGKSDEMTLFGFTDCHLNTDCLGGLEGHYKAFFKSISYMYTPKDIRRRYKALEDGEFDSITTYSTDGRLDAEADKFVALEEDQHSFRAGNIVFVTTKTVVEEAGPDYEETIVAAQEGLTLDVIRRLDGEVEVDGKDPAAVAAAYLEEIGLTG